MKTHEHNSKETAAAISADGAIPRRHPKATGIASDYRSSWSIRIGVRA